MNAEEFYKQILSDSALGAAFEEAIDSGTLPDFLSANGCTASADELTAYIAEHS